jgi:Mg2+ and Co2+ transporter CorA
MKDLDWTLMPPFLLCVGGMVMLIIYIYLKERKDDRQGN